MIIPERQEFPHLYRCGHIEAGEASLRRPPTDGDFRIFIDAATLKLEASHFRRPRHILFPHLYRCGHIEAEASPHSEASHSGDFRIFIDAATLKVPPFNIDIISSYSYFRIFIDAATLKVSSGPSASLAIGAFPHLYRCGHIEGRDGRLHFLFRPI